MALLRHQDRKYLDATYMRFWDARVTLKDRWWWWWWWWQEQRQCRQQWQQQCEKLQVFMWNGLIQCQFTCTCSSVSFLLTIIVLILSFNLAVPNYFYHGCNGNLSKNYLYSPASPALFNNGTLSSSHRKKYHFFLLLLFLLACINQSTVIVTNKGYKYQDLSEHNG